MVANKGNGVFCMGRHNADGTYDLVGFVANGPSVEVSFHHEADLVWARDYGRHTARQQWKNFIKQGFVRTA